MILLLLQLCYQIHTAVLILDADLAFNIGQLLVVLCTFEGQAHLIHFFTSNIVQRTLGSAPPVPNVFLYSIECRGVCGLVGVDVCSAHFVGASCGAMNDVTIYL